MALRLARIAGALASVGGALLVGFWWALYGFLFVSKYASNYTEDGPTCYLAVPAFAIPLAIVVAVGFASLLATGGLVAYVSLKGRVPRPLNGAAVTFIGCVSLLIVMSMIAPDNSHDVSACFQSPSG